MNTKLSGGQLVLLPITRLGKNYFPFIENINRRMIKYIDFVPTDYLPDTSDRGINTGTDNMSITVFDEYGNTELQRNLPFARLDYTQTLGIRQPICSKINLTASYIDVQDESVIGKSAAFVFWYDLPEYSARNTCDNLIVDSISIPITTTIRYNKLPDADRMVGKRFRRLLLGKPSITPDLHTALQTDSMLQNVFITLRKGSYNIIENIPILLFYQLAMLERTEFQNIIFDFQASYITVGGAGTIPTPENYVGKYVFINLQYEK